MRRLLSYFILSLTTFFLVAFNLLSLLGGLNANLEFTSGREMVFRIEDKENNDFVFANDEDVTIIAETMIDRLENALVTKYDVVVEGFDQIRVTVSETSETKYSRLQNYLSFDADFTLCTTTEVCATNDQMFDGQTARIEYKGQNPFVVFPVKDLTYLKEVLITEAGGAESTDGELLLWAGKLESDTYSEALNDTEMASKIILRLPVNNLWWDADNQTELAFLVSPSKYGSANENNIFDAAVVAQANEEAIFYRNLVNAGDLAYTVEFLYSQNIPASIESLISLDTILSIANSQTLWAFLSAMLMMTLVLFIVYRVGALGILATTTLSVFVTFFTFVWLNLEFSSAALLGLITVGILGLMTSVVYMSYVRREIYQGRSLKKSYLEANAKMLPLMIDMSVVGIVFGLFIYILGGNLSSSFAVILMIGSLMNLVIVFLGNQLLFGQMLQSTTVQQHLNLLNLNTKFIPDLVKDQKPVYFGRFATRDFTSKGTLLSPIAVIGGLLSLTAILVLTTFNVPVVQEPLDTNSNRLYLEVKTFSQFETTADVQSLLIDRIFIDGEALVLATDNIEIHELSRVENDIDVEYRIFMAELALTITDESVFTFDDGVNASIEFATFNELLEEVINGVYEDDQVVVYGFYPATAINNQPTVFDITVSALFALLLVGVYLALRKGIAKALTMIWVSGAVGLLTLGIFIATRIPSPATIALSLLTLIYFSVLAILVIFARAKEQQLLITDRALTLDDFTLSLKKASSQSASSIFLTLLALVYLGLTFLAIGPGALQAMFAALLLGGALLALFTTAILPATFKPFYRLFKGFNRSLSFNWLTRRGAKVVQASSKRSNEPQEATFIGIND
jgi:preprotein translocase subunit SecF